MDIHTAALYMKEGFRIRRSGQLFPDLDLHSLVFIKLSLEDLLATDWEIVTKGISMDLPITYSED